MIGEDADSCYDGDVVGAYIDQVRVGRQLKNDPIHKKVMETMQSLQRRDSNMDFEEALVKQHTVESTLSSKPRLMLSKTKNRTLKHRTRNQIDLCSFFILTILNYDKLCFHFIQCHGYKRDS